MVAPASAGSMPPASFSAYAGGQSVPEAKLALQPVVINDPVILVRINQLYEPGITGQALFEATRGVWKVGPRRDDARYALALYRGEVLEIYEIDGWQPAGTADYPTRSNESLRVADRWEFRGSQSPIVYVNC